MFYTTIHVASYTMACGLVLILVYCCSGSSLGYISLFYWYDGDHSGITYYNALCKLFQLWISLTIGHILPYLTLFQTFSSFGFHWAGSIRYLYLCDRHYWHIPLHNCTDAIKQHMQCNGWVVIDIRISAILKQLGDIGLKTWALVLYYSPQMISCHLLTIKLSIFITQ